jgi:hypothetical protein
MKALVHIGTPAVTALVHERYAGSPWYVRLFSHDVLENVHHDAAVDALIDVVPHEDDQGLRGQLGVALASHFDERGIEPALAIYRENPDDRERFTIIERLFAHASLANIDHPDKDEWEGQIRAYWQKFDESRDELDQRIESALDDDSWEDEDDDLADDEWSSEVRSWRATSREDEDDYLPKLQPMVRAAPRVGRNERCPCGSGKKYKNCCMRTAPK